jgi:hypothetical protein
VDPISLARFPVAEALAFADYERAFNDLERAGDQAEREMLAMLDQARKDIIAELGKSPKEWRIDMLSTLLDRVDEQVVKLRTKLIERMNGAADKALGGADDLANAITPGDAPVRMIGIDGRQLQALSDYRADLITGVTQDVKSAVTETVRRSMLGGKMLSDVESELGSVVRDRGRFGSLGQRMKTIVRTEYKRALEMGNHAAMQTAAEHVPGLKRQWLSARGHATPPRPAHAAASGQEVGVDEPFIVGGEKLMYPGDPAGSPGNTINCRCRARPVVPPPEVA